MNVNDNSEQAGTGGQRPEDQDERRDGRTAGQRSELESEKLPDPPEAADDGAIGEILEGEVEPPPAEDPAENPRVGEVAALQEEVGKLKDHLLRTMAEQENAQKRHAKDREDAVKYAASKFAKDMLDVADNLRRAIDSAAQGPKREELPDPVRNLLEGVEATERSLLQAFERNGIQRIEAMGEKFNPNLHEAMFEVEDPNQPAGTVVQVMAPGYTIADRLLRPAQVGVSRGGQAQPRVDTKA